MKREDSTARRDRVSVLIFKNKLLVGMCGLYKFHCVNDCQLVKKIKTKELSKKKCVLIKYMLSLEDIQK